MNEKVNRRAVLRAGILGLAGLVAGCAVNPVTGRNEFMLLSKEDEIAIDRKNAPYQFSVDFGVSRDRALNNYLQEVGHELARHTHRPGMPYSFQCVNAVHVNAYAFPGGTIAATRGILARLGSEAELAALLGHELGHVNARHTARQMSDAMIVQLIGASIGAYARSLDTAYGRLASQLAALGGGMMLASYSRDHEREADALGMEYMVRAGYNPQGEVDLMDMLKRMEKHQPNALELMFATHPMSSERYAVANKRLTMTYADKAKLPFFRERYLDHTTRLRAKKKALAAMEAGMSALYRKKPAAAIAHLKTALTAAPDDYAGLVLMGRALEAEGKHLQALAFARGAKQSYPGEPQGLLLSGRVNLALKRYSAAHDDFIGMSRGLPQSPVPLFYLGRASEGLGDRRQAAAYYQKYLRAVPRGREAEYARKRLRQWGLAAA